MEYVSEYVVLPIKSLTRISLDTFTLIEHILVINDSIFSTTFHLSNYLFL